MLYFYAYLPKASQQLGPINALTLSGFNVGPGGPDTPASPLGPGGPGGPCNPVSPLAPENIYSTK